MKVGIMSMQRIANYGSFLQAYALKKIISDLGHEVCFVDYHAMPPVIKDDSIAKTKHQNKTVLKIKIMLKEILGKTVYFFERYQLMLPLLGISEKMNYNAEIDTLIVGSDEVFNCLQSNPDVGFSPELFGENANAKKIITYAASFGHTTEEDLKKAGKYDEIKGYLSNFSMLSLRDENSAEVVSLMGYNNIMSHLDPVLIYGFEKEPIEKKDIKDYILVYSYAGRIKDEEEISHIKAFAKKHNKKIVTVGFHQPWSDIKLEANPFELLGYVKNADYVVTDTFHGTIFSIIMKKKFATLIRNSNRQKLTSLLKALELENRVVSDCKKLEEIVLSDIDYLKTFDIIKNERKKSVDYLKNNL